jgi:hypothetical protein
MIYIDDRHRCKQLIEAVVGRTRRRLPPGFFTYIIRNIEGNTKRLPQVPGRNDGRGAILLGASHSRREVSHVALRTRHAAVGRKTAGPDQAAVPRLASAKRAVPDEPPREFAARCWRPPPARRRGAKLKTSRPGFATTPISISRYWNCPPSSRRTTRWSSGSASRKLTQETRSDAGQRWSEGIRTVLACAQLGRSAFQYAHAGHHPHEAPFALLALIADLGQNLDAALVASTIERSPSDRSKIALWAVLTFMLQDLCGTVPGLLPTQECGARWKVTLPASSSWELN